MVRVAEAIVNYDLIVNIMIFNVKHLLMKFHTACSILDFDDILRT